MLIDFREPGAWSSLQDHVCQFTKIDPDRVSVRIFPGTASALIEIMYGLAQSFPLKKKIYYVKRQSVYSDLALMSLAKQGYQLLAIEPETLKDPTVWAQALDREVLAVLYSWDDPIVGELFPYQELENSLADKPIFKIRISHNKHFYEKFNPPEDRNCVHVYANGLDQAIAFLGERAKLAPMVSHHLKAPVLSSIEWLNNPLTLNTEATLNFEKSGVVDSRSVTEFFPKRLGDRAILYWMDMDGHAVIDRLSRELGFELRSPGYEDRLETTSLSRWGGVRTMDFLREKGLPPEVIRGLIMIHHQLINGDLSKTLLKVRTQILEDQNGAG